MLPLSWARRLMATVLTLALITTSVRASQLCPDEQATEQLPPADPAYCARLDPIMRKPSALPLDQYEAALNDFIGNFCHRRLGSGWKMDKTVRDAGPFVASLSGGTWSGVERATHMPVLIWYSPEMVAWLKKYRGPEGVPAPAKIPPVPDGAIMIKEMYNSTPAAACQVPDLLKLKPVEQGAAVMVRDSAAARDGWFWGWYGWPNVNSGWSLDYPPSPANGLPFMGFGQYCVNCHASARDNQTFASLSNIKGEPGTFLSFLAQDFYQTQTFGIQTPPKGPRLEQFVASDHLRILQARRVPASSALLALPPSNPDFMAALNLGNLPAIGHDLAVETLKMRSQTYDNVWVSGRGPKQAHAFVTSDQCVGCHSAGGTGLQFEMTAPVPGTIPPNAPSLINFSPYGTWRTSPMGLAGRDPIFFSQLASETQTFHPAISPLVQNVCLGCHGIQGQRQFASIPPSQAPPCPDFLREIVDAVPFPSDNKQAALAHFGGLARDGISCDSCHHMVLGKADTARFATQPQNRCVAERQELLNADNNRLWPHLHRQLLRRLAGYGLWPVRGPQAGADEPRARRRPGAQHDDQDLGALRHLPYRASAGLSAAPRLWARATNRQPIRSGHSALTAPATAPTANCPSAPARWRNPARAATCRAPTVQVRSAARSPVSRSTVISRRPTTGCRLRRSTCRCAPASPSICWSG